MPKRSSRKCSKGQIRRKAYIRKSSRRNGSSKRVYVRSACVPDKGKPGKTPLRKRVLPQPSDKEIDLSAMGYSYKKSELARRRVLKRAAEKYGSLKVMRHLILRTNIQATGSKAKKVMTKDVDYLQKLHQQMKKKSRKTRKKSRKRSRKTRKKSRK
jgi:hypothetical protein